MQFCHVGRLTMMCFTHDRNASPARCSALVQVRCFAFLCITFAALSGSAQAPAPSGGLLSREQPRLNNQPNPKPMVVQRPAAKPIREKPAATRGDAKKAGVAPNPEPVTTNPEPQPIEA